MPIYLSDEWFSRAAELVAAADLRTPPGRSFTLQQVVLGAEGPSAAGRDDLAVAWHLTVGEGGAELHRGRHPDPDVTLTCERDTAWAVQRGELSAQAAFMTGRLRLGGDTGTLLASQELLAAFPDVLAPLRAETTDA